MDLGCEVRGIVDALLMIAVQSHQQQGHHFGLHHFSPP